MQEWEYLILRVDTNQSVVEAQNGQPIKPKVLVAAYCQEVGKQGWELVSTGERVWVFKRPKQSRPIQVGNK